jgi:hypothetical protein
MKFSPYQNIIFDIEDSCGICDKLQIQNEHFYFQGSGDLKLQKSDEFDTNPSFYLFSPATEVLTVSLVPTPTIAIGAFFSIYYGGKYYFYYFDETLPAVPPFYTINTVDNVVYVQVDTFNILPAVNLANAINATVGIDSGGLVVATQVLSTVEVTGIEYFLVQHLTIVTPLLYGQQRVGLNNMYYNDGNICFFNISLLLGASTTTPSFFNPFAPLAGNLVKVIAKVTNSLPFDLAYTIEFLDGSFLVIDTISGIVPANSTYQINEQKNVVSGVGYIGLVFSDPLLFAEMVGFCVEDYEFSEYDILNSVTVKDCNGTVLAIPQTITTNDINSLIDLDFTGISNCCVKIETLDSSGVTHTSNSFEVLDYENLTECLKKKVKVSWFDTCNVDGVDYLNLPFVNEVYLTGYKKRTTQGSQIETFTSASGKVLKTSSLTYPKYQLNIVGYGDAFQYMFERIFEHRFLFIDDKEYTTSEAYEITPLGTKYYNGRIDIFETGRILNKKNCCCNV